MADPAPGLDRAGAAGDRPPVTALDPQEIATLLGVPVYRGRQIRAWVIDRRVFDFSGMTDLPLDLRAQLSGTLRPLSSSILERRRSADGTMKLLVRLEDGEPVECVLIPENDRLTLCISSQVGCPAGCAFCASGLLGLTRNLAAHEIHEQLLLSQSVAGDREITNVVMMGMGEPLLNYDAVVKALKAMQLGARRITVSTVGLPDRMRRFATEGLRVNLAVSLHAPNDELRNQLVPVNRKFGVDEVIQAARDYFEATGRDVTFEYILIDGVNAAPEHAEELAARLGRGNVNVNLIPMNPVEGLPFRPPSQKAIEEFRSRLAERGIPTHVRRPRGREIDAACGQLRLTRISESRRGSAAPPSEPPRG